MLAIFAKKGLLIPKIMIWHYYHKPFKLFVYYKSMEIDATMSEEKIDRLTQKMDIRTVLKAAKCSGGLHMKLPSRIVRLYTLETGDELHVQFKLVRYCSIRETPKI